MKTNLNCCLFLILAIVSPVIAPNDDTEALIDAASRGDINRARSLLAGGTDINTKMTNGVTALWIAAREGHLDIVKVLLESKADVNAKYVNGSTALWMAAWKGHTDIVKALLESKADVNIQRNRNGLTALMVAAREGHLNVVKALLGSKADLNAKDTTGRTARMMAAENGHTDVVQLFPESKAASLESFISTYRKHIEEAGKMTEEFLWKRTKELNHAYAYSMFLKKFPQSRYADDARAIIAKDAKRWKIEGLSSSVSELKGMWFKDLRIGSRIFAEYGPKKKHQDKDNFFVRTFTWKKGDLDRSRRSTESNDNVLAITSSPYLWNLSYHRWGILLHIARKDAPSIASIDFTDIKLEEFNGTLVSPTCVFISEINEKVTGRLEGYLFTGKVKVGDMELDAIETGPPYAEELKISMKWGAVSTGNSLYTFGSPSAKHLDPEVNSELTFAVGGETRLTF